MSDLPAPRKLHVGFSFDRNKTHTFALGWEMDSLRKTIRYKLEFSVDKRTFYAVPSELCLVAEPPLKRIDVAFAAFCKLLEQTKDEKGRSLNIRDYRRVYWRLTAEFHDTSGEKVFGRSTSNVAVFEMPELL